MSIAALWLPILLAAVLVFVASSLIHMVLQWHKRDYHGLPNEDAVREVMRAGAPAPGQYVIPHCSDYKLMRTPEVQKKFADGPVALLTVRANGMPAMGGTMFLWFLLALFVSALSAAIACTALPATTPAPTVFAVCAWVAFAAYGVGSVRDGIWMGKPWAVVARDLLDALIYAGITGGIIAALWPR